MIELDNLWNFWYHNTSLRALNGLTVCLITSLIIYLGVVIRSSWVGFDFCYKTFDDYKDSVINLIWGLVVFLVAAFVVWFTAPIVLPLMFILGVSIITNKLGILLDYKVRPYRDKTN